MTNQHAFLPAPQTFRSWRQQVHAVHALPVVTITGSRGKTVVARVLDHLCRQAGLRTGLRTSFGVEIDGAPQAGELRPWQEIREGLESKKLDVAIQELDWASALAQPEAQPPPVLVVTNICANREDCLIDEESAVARKSLQGLLRTMRHGVAVLNGEDYAVSADNPLPTERTLLCGRSTSSPLMTAHHARGGSLLCECNGTLTFMSREWRLSLGRSRAIPLTLSGRAGFQIHNVLAAAGAALSLGIRPSQIEQGLATLSDAGENMPGSFNHLVVHGRDVFVDRPAPSYFLRPIVRVLRDISNGRMIAVVPANPMIAERELEGFGRLLGRNFGAVFIHGDTGTFDTAGNRVISAIRRSGAPTVVVQSSTEGMAVSRAMDMARRSEEVYLLTHRPDELLAVINSLARSDGSGRDDSDSVDAAWLSSGGLESPPVDR